MCFLIDSIAISELHGMISIHLVIHTPERINHFLTPRKSRHSGARLIAYVQLYVQQCIRSQLQGGEFSRFI